MLLAASSHMTGLAATIANNAICVVIVALGIDAAVLALAAVVVGDRTVLGLMTDLEAREAVASHRKYAVDE